jgi:hypothetical protein
MATWHQRQAIKRAKGAFHYWHETKWDLAQRSAERHCDADTLRYV